jgi:hypothetical protein
MTSSASALFVVTSIAVPLLAEWDSRLYVASGSWTEVADRESGGMAVRHLEPAEEEGLLEPMRREACELLERRKGKKSLKRAGVLWG